MARPNPVFRALLLNTLVANVTTTFLWFALTFWVYLETRSVLATSILGGSYMLLLAVIGVPLGSWIDSTKKYKVMVSVGAATTAAYVAALAATDGNVRGNANRGSGMTTLGIG